MSSVSGDDIDQCEKILVSVRLRPLNAKEIAKDDASDWECISGTTLICKAVSTERSHPNAYTFDHVYGGECTTRQVYEEGAKRVALSALNGINSSIFAYGQTSSGKTYTMTGVTQYALSDIFDHTTKQTDREFVLKFSAIEIYNECVRDLLSADATPLRLLDDHDKGTVVDKLTEIQLEDWTHLMELLSVCEGQRKIGETSMNEISSRSHQIIRLAIESSPKEFAGTDGASTLSAIVNFVDLAGSERASQTNAGGTRLKEGSHINRSLLTLSSVIRKLSQGRNGHIPYRDSKLTRILQTSLGGNARSAIICTLSPAHMHLEQTRNTLLFGCAAKEVRTSAQVNVVVSEKALVKQLQREMARLESQLKNMSGPKTNDSQSVIKEKELHIQKMEQEIRELTEERDLARNRLEEITRTAAADQNLVPSIDSNSWEENSVSSHQHSSSWDGNSTSDASDVAVDNPLPQVNTYSFPKNHKLRNPVEDHYSFDNITPREFMNQYFRPDPNQDTNDDENLHEGDLVNNTHDDHDQSHDENVSYSRSQSLKRSTSSSVIVGVGVGVSVGDDSSSSSPSKKEENVLVESKSESNIKGLCKQDSCKGLTVSVGKKDMETDDGFVLDSPRTLERVMKYDLRGRSKDYVIDVTPKASDGEKETFGDVKETFEEVEKEWCLEFEEERQKIIELWDECNIPLLHRTYFFLLIKGDTSDSVYIEVEVRRLAFLKKTVDHVASARALNIERAMLTRKLLSKYTAKERETMFEKWGIDLESRNRRYQLAQLLWTKTDDMQHISDSAQIVAKLVGLVEQKNTAKEELFALNLTPKQDTQTRTHSLLSTWRNSLSSLRSSYY